MSDNNDNPQSNQPNRFDPTHDAEGKQRELRIEKNPDGVRLSMATDADLATYDNAREQLHDFKVPQLYNSQNPNERVFVALFDGTGNDAINDPEHMTNVGKFRKDLIEVEKQTGGKVSYGYVEGPGTQDILADRTIDAITGASYQERIDRMYKIFTEQVEAWKKENPNVEVRVVSIGFSRGAEQAAGFTRKVDEMGIQDPINRTSVTNEQGREVVSYQGKPLIPPGQTPQAVGLFDPVGTGEPQNHDRRLPPSVVSGYQITAADERRTAFKSSNIIDEGVSRDGRFLGSQVAGAHSDVGGSYKINGTSAKTGNLMADYVNALSDKPLLQKQEEPKDRNQYAIHHSDHHESFYNIESPRGQVHNLAPRGTPDRQANEAVNTGLQSQLSYRSVGQSIASQSVDSQNKSTDVVKDGQRVSAAVDARAAPPANASLQALFDHLYANVNTGDERDFANAIKTVNRSDVGQQIRAQTVQAVDAQERLAQEAVMNKSAPSYQSEPQELHRSIGARR